MANDFVMEVRIQTCIKIQLERFRHPHYQSKIKLTPPLKPIVVGWEVILCIHISNCSTIITKLAIN
jgi:hypothetical protein